MEQDVMNLLKQVSPKLYPMLFIEALLILKGDKCLLPEKIEQERQSNQIQI